MAQVDTSIYNNLQPVKINTPFENEAMVQNLQQGQNQNRLAQRQFQEADRVAGERNALAGMYRDSVGADGSIDYNKLTSGMAAGGQGQQIPGALKQRAEMEKAARETEKANIESHLQKFDVIGRIMSGVRDQASYEVAIQQAGQVLGPEAAANMPQVYDPALIQQKMAEAMTVKDQLEQKHKAVSEALDAAKFGYQQKHDAATLVQRDIESLRTDARGRTDTAKAPAGYRFKQNGDLEQIPGGPADQKTQTRNAGGEVVDSVISGLRDMYEQLDKAGGITNPDNSALSNVSAAVSSSGIGQTVGRALGTTNQSTRNTILQQRPLLLQAIMKATGMSSKQMDSNAELKLYLSTATDPTLDVAANRRALDMIEKLYGSGSGNASITGKPAAKPAAKTITRTGTVNGKKVVEYSDGSVSYAK